ncbi:hypothetical protein Ancab_016479 [Ancistrocladus abbreviatus]
MFRTGFSPSSTSSLGWQESWTRLLPPLALWICVSMSLQHGYYGNRHMVLGPCSSRLVNASPLFVKEIEVRDEAQKGVLIYGFSERPELSQEANWTVSQYLIVRSYSSQGFSLWLNRGSNIRMRWEAHTRSMNHLQVVVIKGEGKYETVLPNPSTSSDGFSSTNYPMEGEEAEYQIMEDDKYYVRVINTNGKNIIMSMNVNVTSKMYDTTKARSKCSTINGSCRLTLHFLNPRFLILATTNNGDLVEWYIELSFVARIVTYIAILGLVVIIIFLILKYLGACNGGNEVEESRTREIVVPQETERGETDPLLPEKPTGFRYGTGEEDLESAGSSSNASSDELYDGKICVICYDEPRNCFFVPCGHCATCFDCAQRIMDGENKVCPICRRLIHKVRKLFTS